MSEADEIIINLFGRLEATTAYIYYKPLKECIEHIEYIERMSLHHYMIFCQPCIKEQVKIIAEYYKMEYVVTENLPKEILMIIADKEIFKPDYEKMKRKLGWL